MKELPIRYEDKQSKLIFDILSTAEKEKNLDKNNLGAIGFSTDPRNPHNIHVYQPVYLFYSVFSVTSIGGNLNAYNICSGFSVELREEKGPFFGRSKYIQRRVTITEFPDNPHREVLILSPQREVIQMSDEQLESLTRERFTGDLWERQRHNDIRSKQHNQAKPLKEVYTHYGFKYLGNERLRQR